MNVRLLSTRGIAAAAIAIAGFTFATTPPVRAQSVTVVVGGNPLYLNPGPIERAGRVFVPLRGIFERLGATVVYQAGTINATKGSTTVSLHIGSTQATVNGQSAYLDVAPFIVGATTYVPLRFVAQSLGANVGYDNATRVVAIGLARGGYGPMRPVPPPNPPPPPAPANVRLIAQQPAPGSSVVNRFVTISAQFSNRVPADSIGVWLDGADVTYRSDVTGASFAYKPPAPLAFGSHTVRVAFTAFGGQRFDRSWSFTIAGAPPVNPVELRAQQPAPGAGVTNRFALISAEFTREVDGSSVRVRLDGNDITSQCGVSRTAFSYKPPAPLELGSHTVRVTGRGLGGSTFDRAWSFRVTAAPVPSATLAIKQPGENAVVGSSFVIRGSTFPNGRVRVTAGATPATTGEFDRSTVAGQLGNFSLKVVLNAMPGQQTVTLKITAVDPATSQTAQTTLQLRLGP